MNQFIIFLISLVLSLCRAEDDYLEYQYMKMMEQYSQEVQGSSASYITYVSKEWENADERGSIMDIADIEWANANAPKFVVSTPEQLAGVVYYVNENGSYSSGGYSLELACDIDLTGLDWVPMGCMGSDNNCFNGVINGNGFSIKNMTIKTPYTNHCAFVGYSTSLYVSNIRFENAHVCGGRYTGIIGGEIYSSGKWDNVYTSGIIEQAYGEVGSIIGREAYLSFDNCEANVILINAGSDKENVEYYSQRLRDIAETPVSEDFTLTLNDDGSITRSSPENEDDYQNLCWHIEADGVLLLQRNAENELTLSSDYIWGNKIWLEAYTGNTYTRISNIIEIQ